VVCKSLWLIALQMFGKETSRRSLEQFGIVLSEQLLQRGGSTLRRGMDPLNQTEDVGRHYLAGSEGVRDRDSSRCGACRAERERRNLLALRFHSRRLVREAFLPARTRLRRRYGGRDTERSGAEARQGRQRLATRRRRKNRWQSLKYFPQAVERLCAS
jgi:hypothetical protein